MEDWVIFPNQLFEASLLKGKRIHFVEHALFFKRPGIRFNKLRLLFMYVVHREYMEYLKKNGVDCMLHAYPVGKFDFTGKHVYDPCDRALHRELKGAMVHDSPSFLLGGEEISALGVPKKRMQQRKIYDYVKQKYGFLEDVGNLDVLNRKPFSKNIPMPKNPYRHAFSSEGVWLAGVKWLESRPEFKNNPRGDKALSEVISEYLIHLPVNPDQVRVWAKDFFKERFSNYGPYQDVVIDENPLLYHSGLSIYLNNGMALPLDIIKQALSYKVPLNSIEGFVRQIAGWREYARYYYLVTPEKVYRKNVFKFTKKPDLYKANTPFPLINNTIRYAMNYGYLNHIQRLMVISNFTVLSEYHPDVLYKWMFEFSLDSYEWVMIFNCYSMGSWSDEGYAMRKPYVSSTSYLLKMTNEKKENLAGWDDMFESFKIKQADVLAHTPLYGRRMDRRGRTDH